MNISYNWLKEYVDFNLTAEEVATALTSIGLEVGSVEIVQEIKGGLEGFDGDKWSLDHAGYVGRGRSERSERSPPQSQLSSRCNNIYRKEAD